MSKAKDINMEVMKVHNLFWESYANRDIELRFSLCSEDVTFIGSGLHERALNKTEYKNINREGVKQFPDPFQIEFLWTNLSLINEFVACIESEVVWSQMINNEISTELLRNTTLLKYDNSKWLVTHVHGSVPDYRLKEGDYMTNEQTIIRNKELERQVFERTQDLNKTLEELEEKNRELEIEASLEKVRTIAMGMREPADMLDVCQTISLQLQSLGVKEIRNVQTAIFYEPRGTYMNYEFYAKHDKTFITETVFTNNEIHNEFATKMLRGKGETFITHIKGSKVKDWIAYQKTTNVFIDKYLETASSLNYYWFSLGPVALGISTYQPLTKEEIKLFKRFLKVFELAYQRYLDIEKAEAQAREAKIEAALERVRSRTMAMQKSDELQDAAMTLFQQVEALGVPVFGCGFNIWDDDQKEATAWMAGKERFQPPFKTSSSEDIFQRIHEAAKRGDSLFMEEQGGEALKTHYEYMHSIPVFKEIADKMANVGQSFPTFQIMHCTFFSQGYLMFISFEPVPDSYDIFIRFANVFEQTYARFLDLHKAEAQAREAQIEAALERVRSRSMAMHKSDELLEAGEILFSEMQKLGIGSLTAGYVLLDEEEKNGLNYAPNPLTKKILPLPVIIPHNETIHMQQVVDNWKKGNPFFIVEMDEAETIKHQTFIAERSTNFPLNAAQLIAISPAKLFLHNFYFKEGYLLIVGGIRLSAEQTNIMLRFTKVFQQTYTRFLDLQKAEAQSREAQIELALERVRARTMAMQKSEELKEVIQIVNKQFVHLNILVEHSGFIMDYKERDDMHIWLADPNQVPFQITIPYFDSPHWNSFIEAKEKGKDFFANHLSFEEKNKFYQDLFKMFHVPDDTKEYYFSCPGLAISTVLLDNVGLYIENFSGIPYSDEENKILMRFGKVFQQSYTRFLDLQKAEAQAREAQIEAALERIRSAAMAMRDSSALSELIYKFYGELTKLDAKLDRCFIMIVNSENRGITWWLAGKEGLLAENGFLFK